MKKMYKSRNEENLLPFHIIKAASEGDVSAINAVLKHYEGYIIKLSTRKLYDESGQVHYCIDETLRRRLDTCSFKGEREEVLKHDIEAKVWSEKNLTKCVAVTQGDEAYL